MSDIVLECVWRTVGRVEGGVWLRAGKQFGGRGKFNLVFVPNGSKVEIRFTKKKEGTVKVFEIETSANGMVSVKNVNDPLEKIELSMKAFFADDRPDLSSGTMSFERTSDGRFNEYNLLMLGFIGLGTSQAKIYVGVGIDRPKYERAYKVACDAFFKAEGEKKGKMGRREDKKKEEEEEE